MTQRLIIVYIIAILFSVNKIFSSKIDSLKRALHRSTGTERATLLTDLGNEFIYLNTDSALLYCNLGLELSKSLKLKNLQALGLNNIASVYLQKGDYAKALTKYIEAEKIYDTEKNLTGRCQTVTNIGVVYELQNFFDKALEQYNIALEISLQVENKDYQAQLFGHLGSVYYSVGNKEKALENFKESLKINEAIKNVARIMEALNNVAVIYQELGKYSEALENFNTDLEYARNMNIKTDVIAILHNISLVYKDQKDFPNAISYLDSSIYLAKEIRDFDDMREAYSTLSEIYKEQNNFPKALESFQLSAAAKDSLLNQTREKQFIEMSTKYETEKKDAENKLLKIEGEKQKTILVAISAGLLLVAALAFLIYSSYRQKKKANVLLAGQNAEIKAQKHIIEEKQIEILDSISYAKRLQDAILPPLNLLKQKFENIFVYYQPKDIVAGDFYWMESLSLSFGEGGSRSETGEVVSPSLGGDKGEVILIAAADCTGHGVPGAMVSVVCSNALNRAVHEFNLREPGLILDKARELVLETFAKSERDVKDGMDISLCSISVSPSLGGGKGEAVRLSWAGANNPLYIISEDHVREVKGDKFPVGAYVSNNKQNFTTHTIEVKKGDRIYLFSDGLPDQFGGANEKKYKYKRMQAKMIESCHLPIEEQKNYLRNDLLAWQGRLEQVDDILVIGIEI